MAAQSLGEVKNIKSLTGYKNYYRIRIGDYRISVCLKGDTVWLAAIAHRKDIYTYFP